MFSDPSHLLVVAVVAFLMLAVLSTLVTRVSARDFPYTAADALLTPAERSFFGVLQQALTPEYHLLAKVRLADVIEVRRGLGGKRRQSAFNRICAKHVDFVACDPQTFRIIGVIELDDSSHRATKRQLRDKFLDSALAAASIPILHVTAHRTYAVTTLQEQARAAFYPESVPPPLSTAAS